MLLYLTICFACTGKRTINPPPPPPPPPVSALDFAKLHSVISGQAILTMTIDDKEPIHLIEENDQHDD